MGDAAGGALPVLAFPAPNLEWLAWFGLVPGLVLIIRGDTLREGWVRAWWFGAGYLIAALYWLAPEVGPAVLIVAFAFGVLWIPFGIAAWKLLRGPLTGWRAVAALAVVPSCWLLTEWLRSWQALGGPWAVYGATQWQHPAVLALASVGGVWLISFALVFTNVAIVLIIVSIPQARAFAGLDTVSVFVGGGAPGVMSHLDGSGAVALSGATAASGAASRPDEAGLPGVSGLPAGSAGSGVSAGSAAAGGGARSWRPWLLVGGSAAIVASIGGGPLSFALTAPFPVVRHTTIAMVQPGIVNDPTQRADASEQLTAELSQSGRLGGVRPDLIVWGESSVAFDLGVDQSLLRRIETLSAQDGAEILVNQDHDVPGKGDQKVGVLVNPSGIQAEYVKSRLVPFGEYIPFRGELGWLTSISKAASANMVTGNGAHLMNVTDRTGRPLPVGVLICFESAFSDMSRVDADMGAQVIVYQSSTSTFQGTWGPDQHASLSAVRAAETGRPVVQAALTGDTVAFDARGRLVAWMGQNDHGVVTVNLGLPAARTRRSTTGSATTCRGPPSASPSSPRSAWRPVPPASWAERQRG